MSHKDKVSVVILGTEDSLKKALITNILGKDLAQVSWKNVLTETKLYENDTYKVVCTPNLSMSCEDIKNLFAFSQHDMCLLVVESEFSSEEVLQQIENLHKTTKLPREEFVVLLPLSSKYTDYPFKVCTMEQVFKQLRELSEDRSLTATDKRQAEHPVPTPHTQMTGNDAGTTVNLVLLGMAGTGKSASGNTILGYEYFRSRPSSKQVTTECQEVEAEICGTPVRVIDTPDIFDDDIKSSDKSKHVTRCNELCQSDPRVYLLVMQVGRFTDSERDVLKKLEQAFGWRVQEQTLILFTCGEELQRADMTLKEFLQCCHPELKKIIEKCGSRFVSFENRASGSDQVQELMQIVDRMLKEQQKY